MLFDGSQRITLRGIVVPSQWDNNGGILGIVISCPNEKDYSVLMDDTGMRLKALLHEEVTITGETIKVVDDREVIKIKRFTKNSI